MKYTLSGDLLAGLPIIARDPTGPGVFGAQEWTDLVGFKVRADPFPWSPADLEAECPFTPGQTVAETHFAFWAGGSCRPKLHYWFRVEPFLSAARSQVEFGGLEYFDDFEPTWGEVLGSRWYLVLRRPVEATKNLAYPYQLNALPDEYECLYPNQLVAAIILARAAQLPCFDETEVRCRLVLPANEGSLQTRMAIKCSADSPGLTTIEFVRDDFKASPHRPIAASRKTPWQLTRNM